MHERKAIFWRAMIGCLQFLAVKKGPLHPRPVNYFLSINRLECLYRFIVTVSIFIHFFLFILSRFAFLLQSWKLHLKYIFVLLYWLLLLNYLLLTILFLSFLTQCIMFSLVLLLFFFTFSNIIFSLYMKVYKAIFVIRSLVPL